MMPEYILSIPCWRVSALRYYFKADIVVDAETTAKTRIPLATLVLSKRVLAVNGKLCQWSFSFSSHTLMHTKTVQLIFWKGSRFFIRSQGSLAKPSTKWSFRQCHWLIKIFAKIWKCLICFQKFRLFLVSIFSNQQQQEGISFRTDLCVMRRVFACIFLWPQHQPIAFLLSTLSFLLLFFLDSIWRFHELPAHSLPGSQHVVEDSQPLAGAVKLHVDVKQKKKLFLRQTIVLPTHKIPGK